MNILFLDDNPDRYTIFNIRHGANNKITWVETAEACINKLKSEKFDRVCLDHDLGGDIFVNEYEKNTGSEVVRYIVNNKESIDLDTLFIIHSFNTTAAIKMEKDLKEAGFEVIRKPFGVFN